MKLSPCFSKRDALLFGWETAKRRIGFFIPVVLIAGLLIVALGMLFNMGRDAARDIARDIARDLARGVRPGRMVRESNFFFLMSLKGLAVLVVVQVLKMGLIQISLRFADDRPARLADLFAAWPMTFRFTVAEFIYELVLYLGLLALVIPGIVWAVRAGFFGYLVVDRGLGPVRALTKSLEITRGVGWDVFLLGLLLITIVVAGTLALLVGLFWALPAAMLAAAWVYRRLLPAEVPAAKPAPAPPL